MPKFIHWISRVIKSWWQDIIQINPIIIIGGISLAIILAFDLWKEYKLRKIAKYFRKIFEDD